MIKKEETSREIREIIGESIVELTCDICKKVSTDFIDIQEAHYIKFQGGYGSIDEFGDGNVIECDICQECLYKMIKDGMRRTEGDPFTVNC